MQGTSAADGKPLSGIDHLRQSIADILSTPFGSRVMRRDYGSRIFELVDQPLNRKTVLAIIAATAQALGLWEPRIKVQSVAVSSPELGSIEVDITGTYLPDGQTVTLNGIKVS